MGKIEKKVEGLVKKHRSIEHILNLLKAASSFNPVAGSIASLITDYIPNQRQIRLEGFIKQLASDLEQFKGEVNDEYIKTQEFAFIFEKCFKGAMENYQQEKIQAFRAVLINSVGSKNTNQNEKEFFLSMIDRLSVIHLRVLFFLANPHQYLDDNSIPRTNVQGSFSQFFRQVMPDVQLDHIKIVFQDLFSIGFINTDKGIFGTITASSGYDLLGDRLTPSGRSFIKFISIS
jgi:hypothetical protein